VDADFHLTLFDRERGTYFVPVRHHSPACAWHLRALLREVRPRQILIEAPIDFEPLIPVLLDPATRPPVAIVAFGEGEAGGEPRRVISYYPFCAHSPEYLALAEGHALGAQLRFIDLPAGARLALAPDEEQAPRSFLDERPFDLSAYTRALCRRTSCRDEHELWDHLFETRLGLGSAETFFASVAAYCTAVRETASDAEMHADGTYAREAHMSTCLGEALSREGPIVVVTGGFHTGALIAPSLPAETVRASRQSASARSYLIRYGQQELDRLNGYASGLPLPHYYQHLWETAGNGIVSPVLWRDSAAALLTGFSAHLRATKPSLTPPLPAIANSLEHAVQLAALRGRPGPTRQDLLDAAQSCLVKGEVASGAAPILDELGAFLKGHALGNVPLSAGSPPLVETVRQEAKRLGFELDYSARKTRELDVHRSERHRRVSRFLHAMAFLETGFANRLGGPDILSAWSLELVIETWTVAWSPMVEAKLIALAADGDTIETVALAEVRRQLRKMGDDGNERGAAAAIQLLLKACQIGLQEHIGLILPVVEAEIAGDPDLAAVTKALSALFLLWRARNLFGMVGDARVERLVGTAYRRSLYLLEGVKDTKEERLRDVLGGLATLREVVGSASGETPAVDGFLFAQNVERRVAEEMPPVLSGAMAALAYLAGLREAEFLTDRLHGHLTGAYVDPADNIAALNGMVAIAPELVWRVPGLLPAIDSIVAGLEDDRFIALLPHLRLAFAALNPRETDDVAARLAEQHGADAAALQPPVAYGTCEAELQANLALSQAIRASLEADGLGHWLTTEGSAAP
jgi:hypothetical protein